MGVIIYSFNLNISPKMLYGCLSVILLGYRITCLWFCNKKEELFVPDPVFGVPLLFIQTEKWGTLTNLKRKTGWHVLVYGKDFQYGYLCEGIFTCQNLWVFSLEVFIISKEKSIFLECVWGMYM